MRQDEFEKDISKGKTIIENAATEPEIVDLATYLVSMGAKIGGIGNTELVIEGVDQLGYLLMRSEKIELFERVNTITPMIIPLTTLSELLRNSADFMT